MGMKVKEWPDATHLETETGHCHMHMFSICWINKGLYIVSQPAPNFSLELILIEGCPSEPEGIIRKANIVFLF